MQVASRAARRCQPTASIRRCLATAASIPYQKDCSTITPNYNQLLNKLQVVRKILNRPLTLSEKILYSHLDDPVKSLSGGGRVRGEAYLQLRPARVAMQDASAQSALLRILLLKTCRLTLSRFRRVGWPCKFNPAVLPYWLSGRGVQAPVHDLRTILNSGTNVYPL